MAVMLLNRQHTQTWTVMFRYNMTKFAICLNEVTPGLKAKLAPTDSRLRPDQHALEEGVFDQVSLAAPPTWLTWTIKYYLFAILLFIYLLSLVLNLDV